MIFIDENKVEVKKEKQAPVLKKTQDNKIMLDENLLQEKGFLSTNSENQRNGINYEFRALKHEIITNAFSDEEDCQIKNLVMLTSALPNEGKTFCAINLALMLSLEKDKSVLLVDADVLKPSIYKVLNFKNRLGLIDYLSGKISDIENVIYNTSIPNLNILPAGTVNSLSYELLASDRMSELNEKLSKIYSDSIIIFDGPPVLGVIETISLSKLVGQVIIVAEHNKTKISEIKEVISNLNHNLFTGLVINKSINNKLGQYGYGYGYGYGKNE